MDRRLVYVLLVICVTWRLAAAQNSCQPADNEHRVAALKECLVIRTFRPANPTPDPILIVYLHGDLNDGGTAEYIYQRAREAVADGRIVVGMVRPGYADNEGNASTGNDFG